MANPIQCNTQALPLQTDVQITVTKETPLQTVDLSVACFVTSNAPFTQGAGRIRYYQTFEELQVDFTSTTEPYKAGRDFFSQSPRANTMAVALAFDTPQPGFLVCGDSGDISAFNFITNGTFTVTVDNVVHNITGADFSSDVNLHGVAATIQASIIGAGGAVTVTASNVDVPSHFTITSDLLGDGSNVSLLTPEGTGSDISGHGFMNGQFGTTEAGYTPTTFLNELKLIREAANCTGHFVYGFALDVVYRDTQAELDAAAWAQAESQQTIMAITSNDPFAYDPGNETNNVYHIFNLGYSRTFTFYHDNKEYYPGMAMLAIALSVDYAEENSTLTMKFKNLVGIPPVLFNELETDIDVLISRRCNTFTIVGQGARVTREGVMAALGWFIDDRTNIDNFVVELQTNVYNSFITNKKIPYTSVGITLLHDAEQEICDNYVRNGAFADRVEIDSAAPNGIKTVSAYQIIFPPLQTVTPASRAARLLAGNQIILQTSGAIHKLELDVLVQ